MSQGECVGSGRGSGIRNLSIGLSSSSDRGSGRGYSDNSSSRSRSIIWGGMISDIFFLLTKLPDYAVSESHSCISDPDLG